MLAKASIIAYISDQGIFNTLNSKYWNHSAQTRIEEIELIKQIKNDSVKLVHFYRNKKLSTTMVLYIDNN